MHSEGPVEVSIGAILFSWVLFYNCQCCPSLPLPAASSSEDTAGKHRLPLFPFSVALQATQSYPPNSSCFIFHLDVHGGVRAHLDEGKQTHVFSVNSEPGHAGHSGTVRQPEL